MTWAQVPPDDGAAVGLEPAARVVAVAPVGRRSPVAGRLGILERADPAAARLGRHERARPRAIDRAGWFLPLRLSLFPSARSGSLPGRRSVSLFRILYRRSYSRGCGYC